MTLIEMKQRYLELESGLLPANLDDKLTKNVNTYGAWSNRE